MTTPDYTSASVTIDSTKLNELIPLFEVSDDTAFRDIIIKVGGSSDNLPKGPVKLCVGSGDPASWCPEVEVTLNPWKYFSLAELSPGYDRQQLGGGSTLYIKFTQVPSEGSADIMCHGFGFLI